MTVKQRGRVTAAGAPSAAGPAARPGTHRQQPRLLQVVVQQAALQAVGGAAVGRAPRHTRKVERQQHFLEQRHGSVLHRG